MKRALLNLPLVVALLLTTAFSADLPVLRAWKTEATFGLWVVVLVPLAVVLLVTQLVLWLACPASRWKHQPATREG